MRTYSPNTARELAPVTSIGVPVKLAMIACDTGRKITWDERAKQIVGDAEAAKLLKREYRAPWKHPWKGA